MVYLKVNLLSFTELILKSFEAALYLCEFLYGKEITKSLTGGLVIDWKLEDNIPYN